MSIRGISGTRNYIAQNMQMVDNQVLEEIVFSNEGGFTQAEIELLANQIRDEMIASGAPDSATLSINVRYPRIENYGKMTRRQREKAESLAGAEFTGGMYLLREGGGVYNYAIEYDEDLPMPETFNQFRIIRTVVETKERKAEMKKEKKQAFDKLFRNDSNVGKKKGGCTGLGKNDCLFNALAKAFYKVLSVTENGTKYYHHPITDAGFPFGSDKEFRDYFEIKHNDKISIDESKAVGQWLKYYHDCKLIIVPGWAKNCQPYYETPESDTCRYKICIQLLKEHYSFIPNYHNVPGIDRFCKKKELVVYWEHFKSTSTSTDAFVGIETYDKDGAHWIEYFSADHEYFETMKKQMKIIAKKKSKDSTCQETYDKFMYERDEVFRISNGKIDFLKTVNCKKTAMYEYFTLNKCTNFSPIDMEEYELIQQASMGAIIKARPGTYGKSYQYDLNMFYPSCMERSDFKIPCCKPVIKEMSKEILEKIVTKKEYSGAVPKCDQMELGIYTIRITNNENLYTKDDIGFLFRFHKYNLYTNYDIDWARKLGLHLEILSKRFSWYEHYFKGSELFSGFVEKFAKIRKQSVETQDKDIKKLLKNVLNMSYGGLCEKNLIYLSPENKYYNIIPKHLVVKHRRSGGLEIQYINVNQPFLHQEARLKPFLYAFTRKTLGFKIRKWVPYVLRVHTDSALLSDKHTILDTQISNGTFRVVSKKAKKQRGEFKYEGHYNQTIIINNNLKPKGLVKE